MGFYLGFSDFLSHSKKHKINPVRRDSCQGIAAADVTIYGCLLKFFTFDKIIFMKQVNSFCISALLAFGLTNLSTQPFARLGDNKIDHSFIITDVKDLFTLSDAEKILGEPAHLVDSGSTMPGVASKTSVNDSVLHIKRTASSYRCVYEANAEDKKTGRTGKVYFLIEQYPDISSAKAVYSYYKRSNETHQGFKEFHDIADEGWTGNSPVSAYMRKGNKLVGVKVNKVTSLTSTDGFNQVVKNIAAAL